MLAFYSMLMAFKVFGCVAIILSGLRKEQNFYFGLAALNVLLFIFNGLSYALLTSSVKQTAIVLSQYQLTCIIITSPLYIYVFGKWSNFKYTHFATFVTCALCLPLVLINSFADYSLRYGKEPEVVEYITFFGDTAFILSGDTNAYFPFIHILYISINLFLLYSAYQLYLRRETYTSVVLLMTLSLQICVSLIGYLLDTTQSTYVYMGGVPMTLMTLLTVFHVIYGYKEQKHKLAIAQQDRDALHDLFEKLARLSNEAGNDDFFVNSIALLSEYTNADIALFGLIDEKDPTAITTRVAIKKQQIVPNFTYLRTGTPCENVLTTRGCIYENSVVSLFPKDMLLADEHIEAYVGYPIIDDKQRTVGILVLLFRQKLPENNGLGTIADVFATRLSAELRKLKLEEDLKATAYIDYVTKLPNRTKLLHIINDLYKTESVNQSQTLLLLFDIDQFGDINRKFGYETGDEILKIVGNRLSSYASQDVFIARNGGDEFAVILTRIRESFVTVANTHWTAIQAILSNTCHVGSRRINISSSMGAVLLPTTLDTSFDIIGSAEHALLAAKKEGRGRFKFFDPALIEQLDHVRTIESELKKAIQESIGLSVHYQPKVTRDCSIIGAEALLRWTHDKLGFVSPVEFIPLAEETGLIHELGDWVLRRVLDDINSWRESSYKLVPISINVTATQFDDDGFVEHLTHRLRQKEIDTRLIEIELTESGLLTEKGKAIGQLQALRKRGFSVALDDFGTGYSSLSYLSQLPLDVLKIDKSFVDRLGKNKDCKLVNTIIDISHAMGLKSVAEGTETEKQVNQLEEMGCEFFQGYFFSKPLPENEFREWLDNS